MSGVPPPPPPAVKYAPKKLPPKIIPAGATGGSGNGVPSPPPPAPSHHHHHERPPSDLKERNSSVASGIIPSSEDANGQQSPMMNNNAPSGGTRQYERVAPPPPPPSSNVDIRAAGENRDSRYAVGSDANGWELEDLTRSRRQLSSQEVGAQHSEDDEAERRHRLEAQRWGGGGGGGRGGIVLPPSSRVASPSRHGHDGSPLHAPPPPHAVASAIRARDDRGKSEDPIKTATASAFGTLNGASASFSSSELVSAAAFNALQHANKEQATHIRELERVVANLTRDNNKLHERIAFLVDCGLSPDLANYEAFHLSSFGRSVNMAAEGRGVTNSAAHESEREGNPFVLPEEATFLKTRVRRLEAALQLEMKAREQLDLKCIAQQTALTQILARHDDEREALQRELYNVHSSNTSSSRLNKEREIYDRDGGRAGRYEY